jgi:general secretion pathway protein D
MKNSLLLSLALYILASPTYAADQTSSSEGAPATESPARADGVPLERIIAAAAKKTGKKFVLDPRVHGSVVILGQDSSELTYPQFLAVLEVYGFVAVDDAGIVQIVPDAMIRQEATPVITSKDTRSASEYVTQVIPLKYISAAQLVPVLRPMLPQQAHLAAITQANALLITDRFSNVRRIETLVKSLDTPENKQPEVETKK